MTELPPTPTPGASTDAPVRRPTTRARLLAMVREGVVTFALVAILFFGVHVVVQNVEVQGTSMYPTLHSGELILVDTLSYRLHAPRRGDIIIFHPPVYGGDDEDYVKRVIGLPGDRIVIRSGTVYINGRALSEPYLVESHTYSGGPWHVPPGDLFVLGDNRDVSYDSHEWPEPYLAENRIIGRAMVAYWPLDELHFFAPPIFAVAR